MAWHVLKKFTISRYFTKFYELAIFILKTLQIPPKSESFPESFKKQFLNYPNSGKEQLSAFHVFWKALSGFPEKLENFHGKFSMENFL